MKQEDKELLLKDLCGRLPYGVKGIGNYSTNCCSVVDTIEGILHNNYVFIDGCNFNISNIKLYLFPLSSMTNEQKVIYGDLCYAVIHSLAWDMQIALNELVDWLNKNHFDYRGLIEKGLAIDATDLNIY